MEKQQETEREPCDSMTTVIMKDLGMDYPDPPPSYKTAGRSATTAVQITKIIAMSGIIIAAMISVSLIFSAWLTSSSTAVCHGNQPMAESLLAAPQQLLQTVLLKSMNDLEAAERREVKDKNSSVEEDSGEGQGSDDDGVVTILSIPFKDADPSQRIPLKCTFEKSPLDGARTLPPLFSLNISTDDRCLRFSGENISICCDLAPNETEKPPVRNNPQNWRQNSNSAVATSASEQEPLQVIGPIPLAPRSAPSLPDILNELLGGTVGGAVGGTVGGLESMFPLLQAAEEQPNFKIQVQELGLGGPIFIPQGQDAHMTQFMNFQRSGPRLSRFQHPAFPESEGDESQGMPLLVQATDLRQRALHQPIPLVPRHHFPHVIRPRSAEEGI